MAIPRQSAGLLLYHWNLQEELEVLIAHPGGPIFSQKDAGFWGIPKGQFEPGETAFQAAVREFEEETGYGVPEKTPLMPLGSIVQRGGKVVHGWAFEGDWEADRELCCNWIDLEWPPGSGQWHHIPEIDEVRLVTVDVARRLMRPDQFAFVERLQARLASQQKLDLESAQS